MQKGKSVIDLTAAACKLNQSELEAISLLIKTSSLSCITPTSQFESIRRKSDTSKASNNRKRSMEVILTELETEKHGLKSLIHQSEENRTGAINQLINIELAIFALKNY